jgi:VWFA-related protein
MKLGFYRPNRLTALRHGSVSSALAVVLAVAVPSLLGPRVLRAQTQSDKQSNGGSVPRTSQDNAHTAPMLKVEARAVLLDVAVMNKKGQPVNGLPKEQFAVTEDGVPQAILFFEEHQGPRKSAKQENAAEPLPANVYTSTQVVKASDAVNVLLLDWLNTDPQDQEYLRSQVLNYLRSVPPGTRLAVFALGKQLFIVQGFTTESARLTAAIEDKNSGANPKDTGLLATRSQKASDDTIIDMMKANNAAPAAIGAVKDYQTNAKADRTGDRARRTLQALTELKRFLAPIPGRKNVFWFAGAFPVGVFPGARMGANYRAELQQTAQQLGPDRIAIYPIAAAAMAGGALDPSQGATSRGGARQQQIAQFTLDNSNQVAMDTLAKETGGSAFYNTNGLDREIARAVDDAEHFYTLSYTPSNAQKDGKFRSIQVKVADGSYKLAYRRGYYAEDAKATSADANEEQAASGISGGENERGAKSAAQSDPLLELMQFGMPEFDQIAYRVQVTPEQPPAPGARRAGANADLRGPVTRYRVDFAIPMESLKLMAEEDGTHRGMLELMVVAYEKNGTPVNFAVSQNEVKLPATLLESGKGVEIHARQEIDVPAGDVYLRAGLYERASGNVGTIEVPLSKTVSTPVETGK